MAIEFIIGIPSAILILWIAGKVQGDKPKAKNKRHRKVRIGRYIPSSLRPF